MKNLAYAVALAALPASAFAADEADSNKPLFAISAGASTSQVDMRMSPAFNSQDVKGNYNGQYLEAAVYLPKIQTSFFANRQWGKGTLKDVVDGSTTSDNTMKLDVIEFGVSHIVLDQLDINSGNGIGMTLVAGHRIGDLTITDAFVSQSTQTDHSNFIGGSLSIGVAKNTWVDASFVRNLNDKESSYGLAANHMFGDKFLIKGEVANEVFNQDGFGFDSATAKISLSYAFF